VSAIETTSAGLCQRSGGTFAKPPCHTSTENTGALASVLLEATSAIRDLRRLGVPLYSHGRENRRPRLTPVPTN